MSIQEEILESGEDLHKFLILLADANDEPIGGKTKLQKMMFLLSDAIDEIKDQSSYDADYYGPYSEIVEEEAKYLKQVGALYEERAKIYPTEIGRDIARKFAEKEDKEVLRLISEVKKFLNDLPNEELLAYVYSAYPRMTEESVEYEELKSEMEKHILSLIKKQKISSQRAAELLGKTQNYVIRKMKENEIAVLS